MSWVENSKDWMILAQGLKLLEKLSKDQTIKFKCYKYRKTVNE